MSPDFWASYISGAAGILIGNPLDLIKVRLQASNSKSTSTSTSSTPPPSLLTTPARQAYTTYFTSTSSLIRGATAPILGYGALNALLFITYNRTSTFLSTFQASNPTSHLPPVPNLYTTFLAGCIGGLATWVISTPTEVIKCRTQLQPTTTPPPASSYTITKTILRNEGVKGLYFGGVVTALRDSIGYGFYFWGYELSTRFLLSRMREQGEGQGTSDQVKEAAKVLLCGGLAGVVTWASIFPLDVIKTRVQTQLSSPILRDGAGTGARTPLLGNLTNERKMGAVEIARKAYRTEGASVFFRGLGVCSVRAFVVNAVQWAVYEWIMRELDPRKKGKGEGVKL